MKKLFKHLFLSCILCFGSYAYSAPNQEYVDMLKDNSLVVVKNNTVETSSEHNLKPLLNYLDKSDFKDAEAYDKTVGRAAALLYVYGDAEYVYADTISKPAIKILKKNKIKYDYKNLVNEIPNKSKNDICPFEKMLKNETNPTRAYGLIYAKTYPDTSVVYFNPEITDDNLVEMFKIVKGHLKGKVALKTHSGEPGGNNFLKPEFMKKLVKYLHATIVECNTAYPGRRDTTEEHKIAIKEHGFDKIAKVDILDEEGSIELAMPFGKQIKVNYVGSHLKNYDSMMVLSHFKGHQMGGFGGALKNISIGIASSYGKMNIHGAGNPKEWTKDQDAFLTSMADASASIMNYFGEDITFINVMNNMSIDCDCNNNPTPVEIADIGMLASNDPVALDKACLDLVYNAHDEGKHSLIERIESRNGILTIKVAEQHKIGTTKYKLIRVK